MNIFVVGATGYIGRQLFSVAINRFHTYGTASSGSGENLAFRLEAPESFNYELIQAGDVVYVAAAISSPDICNQQHSRAWEVNVTGTIKFITKVMSRGGRIVFFSSDAVYGDQIIEFEETNDCHPIGKYAEMKLAVEECFLGNPLFKTIRLSYVFSKEDKFTKYLYQCSIRGVEAEIFDPFNRAVIYLADVIEGALALATCWSDNSDPIVNFGGPQLLSRLQYAQIIRNVALPQLRFRTVEPQNDFFYHRPRTINMKSKLLAKLLGRNPYALHDAATVELK